MHILSRTPIDIERGTLELRSDTISNVIDHG